MAHIKAPTVPSQPNIDLNEEVVLKRIDSASVEWRSISIPLPTKPTFLFGTPPSVVDPTPPDDLIVEIDKPPDVVYKTIEVAPPPSGVVNIPEPPGDLTIEEFVEPIPSFGLNKLPASNMSWIYDEYISSLVALMETKYNDFVIDWSPEAFGRAREQEVWKREYDPMVVRGNNPLDDKDFNHRMEAKGGLDRRVLILKDAISVQLGKVGLSGQQALEAIKRKQYSARKDLELVYAKEVATDALRKYSDSVSAYKALIESYRRSSDLYRARIEWGSLLLKSYQSLVDTEALKGDLNQTLVNRYKIEILIQEAIVKLYSKQMNLAKEFSKTELVEIEILLMDVRKFMAQTKALIASSEQDVIVALAEADKAKALVADALELKASTGVSGAEARLTQAKESYVADWEGLNELQQVLIDTAPLVSERAEALQNLMNSQMGERESLTQNRRISRESSFDIRDNRSDLKDLSNELQENIADDLSNSRYNIEEYRKKINWIMEIAAQLDAEAEVDIAKTMAEAVLTNHLIHKVEKGK
ncbi:MAG TPA: hypothetical protein ENI76_02845 [Ignavibacteria bacterium]|nr:hypothetical protein [Ignavibacteria bacterium]